MPSDALICEMISSSKPRISPSVSFVFTSPFFGSLLKNEGSVQRVFRLVPHYGKTNALLANNIHSSQSIVPAGETRLTDAEGGVDDPNFEEDYDGASGTVLTGTEENWTDTPTE